ncbi:hypothetical protein Pla52n_28860 [Stieleria varia]|uniref:Uncharacterized protein n=1 Tax=Stieleria varia TaxID=2528005 RepID=A0A5C6AZV8_9BACT|nr:hypothetical protein Pla52n_28860 [Stieleria varia]
MYVGDLLHDGRIAFIATRTPWTSPRVLSEYKPPGVKVSTPYFVMHSMTYRLPTPGHQLWVGAWGQCGGCVGSDSGFGIEGAIWLG